MDRIPKPVLFGAVAVIIALALVVIFKSAKNAGGAGDYDADEIRRLAKERASKPNSGRTMTGEINVPMGGAHPGMSSSSGGPGPSGGH